jgi:hypothetical protein
MDQIFGGCPMKKPKPKFPFEPDCNASILGEVIPARYLGRVKDCMTHAWVQINNPPGVYSVACIDLR